MAGHNSDPPSATSGPEAPWRAEWTLNATLVRKLLRAAAPELPLRSIELVAEGWDNVVYRVDRQLLFRLPRRTLGAQMMQRELRILPALGRSNLPVRIPIPTHIGEPSPIFPHPYMGYKELPGVTACRAQLSQDERTAFATPLAQFLRALHAHDTTQLALPGDELHKVDFIRRAEELNRRLEAAIALTGVDPRPFRRMLASIPAARAPKRARLVHGDLYARHLLVSPARTLCGVIDWGDVHAGDVATDLAVVYAFLPPRAHETFFRIYPDVSRETHQLARLRALYYAVTFVVYGADVDDDALTREGRIALELLAA